MVVGTTTAASAGSFVVASIELNLTRLTPAEGSDSGCSIACRPPAADRCPAEAPRPAREWIDGRSPGSRVTACRRLPGKYPVAVGDRLAAHSCGGSCGLGTEVPHRIPVGLFRWKETVELGYERDAARFVNAAMETT